MDGTRASSPPPNVPRIFVTPSEPPPRSAPWWRNANFLRWFLFVALLAVSAIFVSWWSGWSPTALSVTGLGLDAVGITLIASPFASRALLRAWYDNRIRSAEGEVNAHERDLHTSRTRMEEMDSRRRAGEEGIHIEVPDIEPRNSMALDLYEVRSAWRRRLSVPDQQAAGFIIGGTVIAVAGFFLQIAGQFVS